MKNEIYLNPKKVSTFLYGNIYIVKSIDTVTMKGINFLEKNNNCSKIYKGLKDFS